MQIPPSAENGSENSLPREPQPPPLPAEPSLEPPLWELEPPAVVTPNLGLLKSLGLCGIWFLACVPAAVIVELLKMKKVVQIDLFTSLLIQQAIAWPVTLWIGLWWGRIKIREAFPLKAFPARMVFPIVAMSVGLEIILTGVSGLIPMPDFIKEFVQGSVQQAHWVIIGLTVVIVAPITEELFFRGLLLRGYVAKYSVASSVWLTAILFAVFHMNPWQAVVALPMGAICAWLTLRTGSLLPAILTHFVINFTGTALMSQLGKIMGYSDEAWEALDHLPPSVLAIGTVLTIAGGGVLWRQLTPAPPPAACDAVAADEA